MKAQVGSGEFGSSGVFFLLKGSRKHSRSGGIFSGASRECPECLLIWGCGSRNGFPGLGWGLSLPNRDMNFSLVVL